ncbi:MAG: putative polysaccharide biosynthesis protein [Blautia sp.]|jgi:stage V sporulation protein B
MGNKKDNTLVKNASFLMVAALISKIIGMIYKSPLSDLLGNEGYGCFQYAQNAYFILLMIASFSIPQAVSKIMAERLAFHRYRDAQKAFYCSLLYAVIIGGIVALVCVFGTKILVPEDMANARLALQMLAPTIFISGILGVLRGYFQAYRKMMPTSISQIVEQIMVAVVAILMTHVMLTHFAGQPDDVVQRWSAAGATIGTGAGVLSALLFMLFVYGINRRTIRRKIARDRSSKDEAFGSLFKTILLIISPIIFSAFIYNVNGFINSYMFTGIMGTRGMDSSTIKAQFAEYGYYMTLVNIPLTLASTAPTSMIPEVSAHYARGEIRLANEKTDKATWVSMLISIPAAVGLGALAVPISQLLFSNTEGFAANMMYLGAVTIVLNGMSNISNGVLQGIGKPKIPMIHAALALVADVILMAALLFLTNLGVYTVVVAMIVYAIMMCVLNDRAMKKYMKYRNPWRYAYLPPLLASIPMGLVAAGVYYGLHFFLPGGRLGLLIALIPAITLAVIVYFLAYLFIARPTAEELSGIPGGRTIAGLAHKLGI